MSKEISHKNHIVQNWSKQSFDQKKKRARALLLCLRKRYPRMKTVLVWRTPMQMLASVMFSAQTTDKKVNEVTQKQGLFKKYSSVDDFADADLRTLQKEIRPLGFFRQKSKHIIASARMIRDEFGGKLPKTLDEMTRLPGVARKTANIVLNHVYGIAEGIPVDTHVRQVANRFGFTKEQDPVKIEKDLMALFPEKDWIWVSYTMVEYNRAVHSPPKPKCEWCYVTELCFNK
ncbi:MAG: endonuclease III [Candidatus Niyogibacteria bacterium]|nr:endonuclease III [Candidatus Niyogibacteria bacterium]